MTGSKKEYATTRRKKRDRKREKEREKKKERTSNEACGSRRTLKAKRHRERAHCPESKRETVITNRPREKENRENVLRASSFNRKIPLFRVLLAARQGKKIQSASAERWKRAVPEENRTAGNRPQRPSLLISKITAAPCPRHGRLTFLNSRCAQIRKFRDVWRKRTSKKEGSGKKHCSRSMKRITYNRVVYLLTERGYEP